jgi:hypothetical protein
MAAGRPAMVAVTRARKLTEDSLIEQAQLGGATPLWQRIDDGATVFSTDREHLPHTEVLRGVASVCQSQVLIAAVMLGTGSGDRSTSSAATVPRCPTPSDPR